MLKRSLQNLEDRVFDVVVVGGGIFGACAACDAAQRGLSVALIERGDFGGATSAHSFKMIHGGIRYLQHADFVRVRQSSDARRTLLRVAPHLTQPLPIVVPTYGHGMQSKAIMRCAMAAYDTVTFDRNAGIADRAQRVPSGRCLSRSEVLDRYPMIRPQRLTGAAIFTDGQMYNPPRLVLSFVSAAVEAGAVVANHVEATRFLRDGNRVHGVVVRDTLSGDELDIRCRMVVNAAGPYAERLLVSGLGRRLQPVTPWSRDAYFVVPRTILGDGHALAAQTADSDPDAKLSRGGRHLFLVPWRGYTLVGVWHKLYEGDPDGFRVSDRELRRFVDEINAACPGLDLGLDDVSFRNAGLVPFGENDPDATDLRYGHRSRLVDHATEDGIDGIVTLIGVRYTTGPGDACRAVDVALRKLARKAPRSRLHCTPVPGGDFDDFEQLVRRATAEAPPGTDAGAVRALVRNHGTGCGRVLTLASEQPAWAGPLGRSTVLGAEIIHAVRAEMAQSLADIVFRRTDLATGEHPGADVLRTCARIASSETGWSADRIVREIDAVEQQLRQPASRSVEAVSTDEAEAGPATTAGASHG